MIKNPRLYFDSLSEKLGIQTQCEWYNYSYHSLAMNKRSKIWRNYGFSLQKALQSVYPEYDWYPWLFSKLKPNFFEDEMNRRRYMEWLASELGIHKQEDWFGVTVDTIARKGGKELLYTHGGLTNTFKTLFPQFEWHPWFFQMTPHNYWRNIANQRVFFDWLGSQLRITDFNQWRNITIERASAMGASSILSYYGKSLMKALKKVYPEHQWNLFPTLSEGHQNICNILKNFLLNRDLKVNYKLWNPSSSSRVELDVYIPSLNVAIEYQGSQHYTSSSFMRTRAAIHSQIQRDRDKKSFCAAMGIRLIQIPFWCNANTSTLMKLLNPIHNWSVPLPADLTR